MSGNHIGIFVYYYYFFYPTITITLFPVIFTITILHITITPSLVQIVTIKTNHRTLYLSHIHKVVLLLTHES